MIVSRIDLGYTCLFSMVPFMVDPCSLGIWWPLKHPISLLKFQQRGIPLTHLRLREEEGKVEPIVWSLITSGLIIHSFFPPTPTFFPQVFTTGKVEFGQPLVLQGMCPVKEVTRNGLPRECVRQWVQNIEQGWGSAVGTPGFGNPKSVFALVL